MEKKDVSTFHPEDLDHLLQDAMGGVPVSYTHLVPAKIRFPGTLQAGTGGLSGLLQ